MTYYFFKSSLFIFKTYDSNNRNIYNNINFFEKIICKKLITIVVKN